RSVYHRYLHSFPTRRSSDLSHRVALVARSPHSSLASARNASSRARARAVAHTLSCALFRLADLSLMRSGIAADTSCTRLNLDGRDRKSTRLNSSHVAISYAV